MNLSSTSNNTNFFSDIWTNELTTYQGFTCCIVNITSSNNSILFNVLKNNNSLLNIDNYNNLNVYGAINSPAITSSLYGTSSVSQLSVTSSYALTSSALKLYNQDTNSYYTLSISGLATKEVLNISPE